MKSNTSPKTFTNQALAVELVEDCTKSWQYFSDNMKQCDRGACYSAGQECGRQLCCESIENGSSCNENECVNLN